MGKTAKETTKTKEHAYYVKGMHCASCEILIENKLLQIKNIKKAKASTTKGKVVISCDGKIPSPEKLNEMFKTEGYTFSNQPIETKRAFNLKEACVVLGAAVLIIAVFTALNKSGLLAFVNVNEKSSIPTFFVFGLLASLSSCAALVGGIVLSLSKHWSQTYPNDNSNLSKIQPHLMFNAGRIISYTIFGAILGAIGNKLSLSLKLGPVLVIAVSVIMIILAFQMLGLKTFEKLRFSTLKFAAKFFTNKYTFRSRYTPFVIGWATFFLPCGFTLTAQSLALISASAIQGALIMGSFALGTLPMLLLIGLSSVKFLEKPHLSQKFLKVSGVLVLFFAFYNINSQLNVLGISNFGDLGFGLKKLYNKQTNNLVPKEDGLPPIINGKQVIKMEATAYNYFPNYFKVKVGIPVRWEITDKGVSGCTNAIISRELFNGEILLTPGQTSVKEFTPTAVGKYKFSCWMGMASGVIEVVN